MNIKCGNYDENLKNLFKIESGKNYFRIRVRKDNIEVNVKRRFSNESKKEEAKKKMEEMQKDLIKQYS